MQIQKPTSQRPQRSRIKPWLFPISLLLLMAGLAGFVVLKAEAVKTDRTEQQKEGPPPINVVTLEVSPTSIRDKVTLPAEVLAFKTLNLPAEVNATFVEKIVSEGDFVSEGDVVALLDTTRYTARLDAALSTFDQAVSSRKRTASLHTSQLATAANVEQSESALEQARSAVISARMDLLSCTVTAPFSGYLDYYTVEEGAFVTAGSSLCRLLDTSRVKVRAGIPESDVPGARSPDGFLVYVDAMGKSPITGGKISRLSRNAGNMAKLYDLDIILPNPTGALMPDMFARVELIKTEQDHSLVVPLYTIITRGKQQIIFVVEKGIAQERVVTTGIQEGWLVEVTQGLEAGDTVIIKGQRSVTAGREVSVVQALDHPGELNP